MKIIGITGTIGAGKGTMVNYLVEQHGFYHYSVRGYLTELIKNRNLPMNRDSMVEVANELRTNHNPAFIIQQLLEWAKSKRRDCIIESIRTPGEVAALRKTEDFILFAIDADPEIRYRRIVERGSETDNITFKTFMENEQREMNNTDLNKQNLSACIKLADYVITNGTTFHEMYNKIEHALYELTKEV